jgi:hypothetical protein
MYATSCEGDHFTDIYDLSNMSNTEPELVATGTFVDSEPKRIVAKRIILTGHPFKIHKRSAVIRYMFFSPG